MTDIDDLDAAAVLARAESGLFAKRLAELEDLELVSRWAELHGDDPRDAPGAPRRRVPGSARLEEMGGDGTPLVQDLCLDELAVARRTHVLTTRSAMADVLDLQHRLPLVWQVVCRLECDAWVARKVAVLSRCLDRHQVRLVDAAIADCIGTLAPSRVLSMTEAKVVEADPVAHAARVRAEQERRYVALTRTDEAGLRTVIARVEAGDAVWVDATVNRVAEILVARGDDRPRDVVRALAFGYLARPAELLVLLLENADSTEPTQSGVASEASERSEPIEPEEPVDPDEAPAPSRALAFPADLLEALRACDPKERVHLHGMGDVFPHATGTRRKLDGDHVEAYDANGPPGQTSDTNIGLLGRFHHRTKTHQRGWRVRNVGDRAYLWRSPHGLWRLVDPTGTHAVDVERLAA